MDYDFSYIAEKLNALIDGRSDIESISDMIFRFKHHLLINCAGLSKIPVSCEPFHNIGCSWITFFSDYEIPPSGDIKLYRKDGREFVVCSYSYDKRYGFPVKVNYCDNEVKCDNSRQLYDELRKFFDSAVEDVLKFCKMES